MDFLNAIEFYNWGWLLAIGQIIPALFQKRNRKGFLISATIVFLVWVYVDEEHSKEMEHVEIEQLERESNKSRLNSNSKSSQSEPSNKSFDPCDNFSYTVNGQKRSDVNDDHVWIDINCNNGRSALLEYDQKNSRYGNTLRSSQHEAAKKACGCD